MAPPAGEKETRYLKTVMKERPDSLLFARLADVYRKEGNIDQAIELCINGLDAYPYYTTGRILLGRCYLEQQKTGEAIQAFSMVCTTDRRNQVAIKMLADIFARQGMDQKAGDLYALLLSMDPDQPALQQLSTRYAASGTTDLFAILGLRAGAGGRMVSSPTPFEDHAIPDGTYIEQPDSSFGQYSESGDDVDGQQSGFSAGDTSGPPPDVLETTAPADVSGTDVSDRMSMLFNDQQAQSTPVDQPEVSRYSEDTYSADEPELGGILNPDADDVSGTDISNRIEELFSENDRISAVAPDADFAVDSGGKGSGTDGFGIPSADTASSQVHQVSLTDEAGVDISGSDISSRLGELFGDEQAGLQQGEDVDLTGGFGTPDVAGVDIDYGGAMAADDFNVSAMDQDIDVEGPERLSSVEDQTVEVDRNSLLLDNFQMPDEPVDDAATPDFPELNLSYDGAPEPDMLPPDEGAGMSAIAPETTVESTGLSDDDSERLPEGFSLGSLDESEISDTAASIGIDSMETVEGPATDFSVLPSEFTNEDSEDIRPSDLTDDVFAGEEPESGAGHEMITGTDVIDRISTTFESPPETPAFMSDPGEMDRADGVGESSIDVTSPVDAITEAAVDDSADEAMITGTDIIDRISSTFEGTAASPGASSGTEESDVFESTEAAVTGDDVADRLEMVLDNSEDAPFEPEDRDPAFSDEESLEKTTIEYSEALSEEESSSSDASMVTGNDVEDRIAEVFSENDTDQVAEIGLPAEFSDAAGPSDTFSGKDAGHSMVFEEERSVTGDDVSDRIEMVFEGGDEAAVEPGPEHDGDRQETFFSNSDQSLTLEPMQEENYYRVSDEIDELTGTTDDSVAASDAGPSTASLAEASDTLFAEKFGTLPVSDDEVIDQDFIAPDFEETMQFDSALFEQMLNPTTQSAPYMRDESEEMMPALEDMPLQEAAGPADSSVEERAVNPEQEAASDLFEISDADAAPQGQELVLDTGSDEDVVNREDDFELVTETPDEDFGFEVTTEQYVSEVSDLIEDAPPPEMRLDKTAVFEVNVTETHTDLILEDDEPVSMEEMVDRFERTEEDTSGPFNLELISGVEVSDHTESVDVFLEEFDDSEPPDEAEPEAATITGDKPVPDETFAGVVLVDSNQPDEPRDDDAAFLETMQATDVELFEAHDKATGAESAEGTDVFEKDAAIAGQSDASELIDGPPVIFGSDVEERLDTMFQGDDLLSLSADDLLPPEDEQDEVMDRVSEFYTISGENAGQGAAGEVPDTIGDVEFDAESAIENGATVELSMDDMHKMMAQERQAGGEAGEVLPEVELFEECQPGVEQFSEETVAFDKRDKPFDIPDHVLTPTLADIYFQQGQYQLALEIYTRLSERDPDNEKLTLRLEEVRQAVIDNNGNTIPDAEVLRDVPMPQKNIAGSPQKKKTVPRNEDTAKPLAGVRIKKRIKNARKSARKRS